MTSEAPSTSFSASGEDAIHQVIDVVSQNLADELSSQEFDNFYDIERTAKEIIHGKYNRIALQFPDELLHDSVPIFHRLNQTISTIAQESGSSSNRELYVLADTSYGSCCVDEVAAQHVNADLVVHYGHACMTQTSRLPVIYVFGKKSLDVERCVAEFLKVFNDANPSQDSEEEEPKRRVVLLKHDVVYNHIADAISSLLTQALSPHLPPISVLYQKVSTMTHPPSKTITEDTSSSPAPEDREADQLLEPVTIFYVGGESLGLSNLLMTNALNNVYRYDPVSQTVMHESASGRSNKMLMRRYAAVQKARDADVFGILVGTLGVASYLPLIGHIRRLLTSKQKKTYTISVGKLNPAKLANFLEVECFVLIACPENTLISDKEFLRPIITPYELEIAMQADRSWTGKYVLDFGKLLAEADANPLDDASNRKDEDLSDNDPDQPVFSLVTGTYRHHKRYGAKQDIETENTTIPNTSAIMVRNKDDQIAMVDSAAAQFLQQRTYRGLETRLGADAPSILEQGRTGIARGYQDDLSHKDFE